MANHCDYNCNDKLMNGPYHVIELLLHKQPVCLVNTFAWGTCPSAKAEEHVPWMLRYDQGYIMYQNGAPLGWWDHTMCISYTEPG